MKTTNRATRCGVPEETVLAYAAGELDDAASVAVAEHLAECDACCAEAAEYRALRTSLPRCCAETAVRWHAFDTPFGRMFVAATDRGLVRVSWQQPRGAASFVRELERRFPGRPVVQDATALAEAERQIREYFDGNRTRFDLPVDFDVLDPFDRRVLATAFRTIGFGEVVAYGELARRIGKPRAARAVGGALGRNPVAIVVPCHRVVRRDGSLGGYGGGVHWKRRLLALEGRRDLLRAG